MYQTKNKLEASIKNNNNYVKNTIDTVLKILEDNGFICKKDNYELTLKGEYATNIHEIHPLIMAEIVNDGVMDSLSETELCVVFSIFTNIRLSDENKVYSINEVNTSNKTKSVIKKILEYNDKYYNIESKHQLDFSNEYEHHFDMCDLVQDWCNAEDDHACSKVYSDAEYYGIYNGDFIKAIRKINNMVNEFENICLLQENMALLNKIKNIPSMILKSIATNQSLYI
jgi:superfamily II RNA helicase